MDWCLTLESVCYGIRGQSPPPVDKRIRTRRKAGLFLPVCRANHCLFAVRPKKKPTVLTGLDRAAGSAWKTGGSGALGASAATCLEGRGAGLGAAPPSLPGDNGKSDQRPFFSSSRISRSSTTSSGGAAGLAASALMSAFLALLNTFTIWKMMKARIRKFRKMVMKLP